MKNRLFFFFLQLLLLFSAFVLLLVRNHSNHSSPPAPAPAPFIPDPEMNEQVEVIVKEVVQKENPFLQQSKINEQVINRLRDQLLTDRIAGTEIRSIRNKVLEEITSSDSSLSDSGKQHLSDFISKYSKTIDDIDHQYINAAEGRRTAGELVLQAAEALNFVLLEQGARDDPQFVAGVGLDKVIEHLNSAGNVLNKSLETIVQTREVLLSPFFLDIYYRRGEQYTNDNILFFAPKHGGILQSSCFLDLQSLMALCQTCKAHAFDELSFIRYIEHELTRDHDVHTSEAIDFLKLVWSIDT